VIVVLSLNTAVDRIMVVPGLRVGEVFRAEESRVVAGGKGLNVARVVRQLGSSVRVVGFLGGMAAPFIHSECERIGIDARWVTIAGETRTCVIAVDPDGGQTVLNEPGPTVSPDEINALAEAIQEATAPGDLLCISGSAPPSVPDDFYAEIVAEQQQQGVRVLVDVGGLPLRLVWEAGPWAIKPNLAEARAAFGMDDKGSTAALRLAQRAEHALVTDGAEGVWHASGTQVTGYRPPRITVVNAVGSGDALAAGFLVGVEEGLPADDAVRLSIACGAANAMRLEPGIGSREQVEQLRASVVSLDAPAR
jgi:1-phosphofructokinase family hexose kinase